jgi:transposase
VSEAYEGKQIVGIDLHRRRSVLVRMTEAGEHLETVRISNDPEYLRAVMARAGEAPEVVLEATYGWYWAADTLAELGANVHLAHPLGVKMFSYRRVKNDERDAADLADLLRMGRLPEAWIAPPATRELRELVRHRAKLVALRSNLKCQVHAVFAGCGVPVVMSDLFGAGGQRLLEGVVLPPAFRARLDSARRVIETLDFEVEVFTNLAAGRLREHRGYTAIQAIPGVGAILGAVFVAEIGQVSRFRRAAQLTSWAGLTPKHYESDTHVHAGGSPNRAAPWSAGPPWRPSNGSASITGSGRSATRSDPAAEPTSARSPPPENCSPWSTTDYATGTSAACTRPTHDLPRTAVGRGSCWS